jgi:hypothetical protein
LRSTGATNSTALGSLTIPSKVHVPCVLDMPTAYISEVLNCGIIIIIIKLPN